MWTENNTTVDNLMWNLPQYIAQSAITLLMSPKPFRLHLPLPGPDPVSEESPQQQREYVQGGPILEQWGRLSGIAAAASFVVVVGLAAVVDAVVFFQVCPEVTA